MKSARELKRRQGPGASGLTSPARKRPTFAAPRPRPLRRRPGDSHKPIIDLGPSLPLCFPSKVPGTLPGR